MARRPPQPWSKAPLGAGAALVGIVATLWVVGACNSAVTYTGVARSGNGGGEEIGGGGEPNPAYDGGDEGDAGVGDGGDAGQDAGLAVGFSCIPSGAYNGGCAPGLACAPIQSSTVVTYTCQSETNPSCDGGCLVSGEVCDPTAAQNGGCETGLDCVVNLAAGTFSTCEPPGGVDAG